MGKARFLRGRKHLPNSTTTAVEMPREKFIEIVDSAVDNYLQNGGKEDVAEELRNLARTTDRAAHGRWSVAEDKDFKAIYGDDAFVSQYNVRKMPQELVCGCPLFQISSYAPAEVRADDPKRTLHVQGSFFNTYDQLMASALRHRSTGLVRIKD